MHTFSSSDFGYDHQSYGTGNPKDSYDKYSEDKDKSGREYVKRAVDILNSLTEEQKKAVLDFGRAQYREGKQDGYSEADSNGYINP